MKIGSPQAETKFKPNRVVVQVKVAGEGLEGKQKGKQVYQTFNSIDITETTAGEVYSVILRALEAASKGR